MDRKEEPLAEIIDSEVLPDDLGLPGNINLVMEKFHRAREEDMRIKINKSAKEEWRSDHRQRRAASYKRNKKLNRKKWEIPVKSMK